MRAVAGILLAALAGAGGAPAGGAESPAGAAAGAGVRLAQAGWEGWYRPGCWCPVVLGLEGGAGGLDGQAELRLAGEAGWQVYRLQAGPVASGRRAAAFLAVLPPLPEPGNWEARLPGSEWRPLAPRLRPLAERDFLVVTLNGSAAPEWSSAPAALAPRGRHAVEVELGGRRPDPEALLPGCAEGYEAIGLLVLNTLQVARLPAGGRAALADWLRAGGRVVATREEVRAALLSEVLGAAGEGPAAEVLYAGAGFDVLGQCAGFGRLVGPARAARPAARPEGELLERVRDFLAAEPPPAAVRGAVDRRLEQLAPLPGWDASRLGRAGLWAGLYALVLLGALAVLRRLGWSSARAAAAVLPWALACAWLLPAAALPARRLALERFGFYALAPDGSALAGDELLAVQALDARPFALRLEPGSLPRPVFRNPEDARRARLAFAAQGPEAGTLLAEETDEALRRLATRRYRLFHLRRTLPAAGGGFVLAGRGIENRSALEVREALLARGGRLFFLGALPFGGRAALPERSFAEAPAFLDSRKEFYDSGGRDGRLRREMLLCRLNRLPPGEKTWLLGWLDEPPAAPFSPGQAGQERQAGFLLLAEVGGEPGGSGETDLAEADVLRVSRGPSR